VIEFIVAKLEKRQEVCWRNDMAVLDRMAGKLVMNTSLEVT
jgi:hypothetical protein